VQNEDKERSCWSTFVVITESLIRETGKKQRAFRIGIFTVFLVVMVITMLKSVVDCTPILFVRIGQDAAGAVDYQLQAPSKGNAMIKANVNFYDIDPFNNPF
jgi:hypothetical protein